MVIDHKNAEESQEEESPHFSRVYDMSQPVYNAPNTSNFLMDKSKQDQSSMFFDKNRN